MLNIFDIGIILVLISFIIVGYKRGVIKELVSLIGIIIVFILSWSLKGLIGNILCIYLPFFKFKGSIEGFSSINIMLYQIIAFMIVFSVLLVIYSISLKLSKIIQKIVNATIILILPSKILGGIVSFIKGYILLLVIFLLLYIPIGDTDVYKESTMINFMLYKTPVISSVTNSFTKPIEKIVDLGKNVKENKISKVSANKKAIEIMIEYNIVDEETVSKLYVLKKI